MNFRGTLIFLLLNIINLQQTDKVDDLIFLSELYAHVPKTFLNFIRQELTESG